MSTISLDTIADFQNPTWLTGPSASTKQIGGDHYKKMAIQPSDFIDSNSLGWYEGNAVKYICRHKAKGGKEDLFKAIHYLQLALEKHYG